MNGVDVDVVFGRGEVRVACLAAPPHFECILNVS